MKKVKKVMFLLSIVMFNFLLFSAALAEDQGGSGPSCGAALAENQVPNKDDFSFIEEEEKGASVAAVANYDDGRSAIVKFANGKMYCVTNKASGSYWQITPEAEAALPQFLKEKIQQAESKQTDKNMVLASETMNDAWGWNDAWGVFDVKVEYISDAVGTDGAIYRVSIEAGGLDTERIFGYGWNGIKCTLSYGEPEKTGPKSAESQTSSHNSNAYPITGVFYESNNPDSATIKPRKISFLWLGPKDRDKKAGYKLCVKELVYSFSDDKDDKKRNIAYATIDLPAAQTLPDYSSYKVEIVPESEGNVSCVANGTCAAPFNIKIKDSSENVIDDKKEEGKDNPYDHLVFYATDGHYAKKDGLIGCDPKRAESEFVAIIPAEAAEIDGNDKNPKVPKYIKYGKVGKSCKTNGGRTYYAYTTEAGKHEIRAGLVTKNKQGKSELNWQNCVAFQVTGNKLTEQRPNSFREEAEELNRSGGRNFAFPSGKAVSNWQGNESGYGGYLDYQLTTYKGYTGVFVYLPEGLNTRTFEQRKDLRKSQLQVGYYFDPVTPDEDNPLWATSYHINDTPSYCDIMRGKALYALLFNKDGECVTYNVTDNNKADALWTIPSGWGWRGYDTNTTMKNYRIQIGVGNYYKVPIIMGTANWEHKDTGVSNDVSGIAAKGLFVPPTNSEFIISDITRSGVGATFMTNVPLWIAMPNDSFMPPSNIGYYKIEGYKLTVAPGSGDSRAQALLFCNSLEIKHDGICWPNWKGCSIITVNVSYRNSQFQTDFPETGGNPDLCTSLNRLVLTWPYPKAWHTALSQLNYWDVHYIGPKQAKSAVERWPFRPNEGLRSIGEAYFAMYATVKVYNLWDGLAIMTETIRHNP